MGLEGSELGEIGEEMQLVGKRMRADGNELTEIGEEMRSGGEGMVSVRGDAD